MIKKYRFIYFVSTQRNLPFLIISDTVYLALLCRYQLAAHQKKLGGGGWGGGRITTVGCRYFRNFTVSFRSTRKHLKVIGSGAYGQPKHLQSLHHVLSYSSTQALKVAFGYEIVRHFLHKQASIPLENTVCSSCCQRHA